MYNNNRGNDSTLGWVQAIPVAISTFESISHLFSGGASLADKIKTRIAWTVNNAQLGSVLAAAIVIGGARESTVNASERQAWADVVSAVPADTLDQARARYPNGYWPVGQPDFYTDTLGPTHSTIVREVNAAAAAAQEQGYSATPPPGMSAPQGGTPAHTLPAQHTVAPFNWVPFALAGAVVLLVVPNIMGPSRRR